MTSPRFQSASIAAFALLGAIFGCSGPGVLPEGDPKLHFPEEKYLKNIRQLTAGGTNAEAYWSFDGEWLSFQHTGPGFAPKDRKPEPAQCDQIYRMRADGSEIHRVSSGKGRTTCAFYFPDDSRILYASTFQGGDECPPHPDHSKGYVWPIYDTYQIYSAKPDGSDVLPLEPGAPRAYNAEAVVCKDGSVVFTSDRDGDLDLYVGKLDMSTIRDVKRVTHLLGYDGGAVFSPDCSKIVWRASRPKPGKEAEEYKALLKQHLVRPSQLEIWVANVDGSHARQVTQMGTASFAPIFTPDGQRIIFSSNPRDPRGRHFDLYKVNIDGTHLERVTFSNTFESFPMFSPDGKRFAFSSNRNAKAPRETNVFIADWVEVPPTPLTTEDPNAANRFMALVQKLSAPEMEGRGIGTEGLKKSEELVARQFAALGLKPFFSAWANAKGGELYRQAVEIRLDSKTGITGRANNIVASWGDACGKTSPIVIGAHLDHLGHGADISLEPSRKGLHAGADDNASGVAAMMEAARIITASNDLHAKSCFIFAAFTGEETGIAGSSRLTELFKTLKIQPKAMLNLDMVGRMENNKLTVFGTDSAKELRKLVADECGRRSLDCPGGGDGYGPSDHMAFYIAKVPVLHFFTGPHVDYHRVSDTAEKINATGGIQTAQAVAGIALAAASPKVRFTYQKATKPENTNLFGKARAKSGAYLGTIPDYSSLSSPHGPSGGGVEGGGIRLAGTRPGSPADKAGIKEGDILMSIDSRKIDSLEGFMTILSSLKPDQEITLEVKREGKLLKLPAKVGKKES
ncbi:MAG: M28 family peptidase [Oligoflexia bacterium]|nr:M28 family peptidase [Oligoflexia bacterium]